MSRPGFVDVDIGSSTPSPTHRTPSPSSLSSLSFTPTPSLGNLARTVGLGLLHPSPVDLSKCSNISIGATSFPLLPRLEDAIDPPTPTDEVHSLTAILNDPHHSDDVIPLPLVIPPLPWTNRDLQLTSITSELSSLSTSLARLQSNHPSLSSPRALAEDEGVMDGKKAAEQLKACLQAVPARFFEKDFDEIEEAFSFMKAAAVQQREPDEEGAERAEGIDVGEEEEKVEGDSPDNSILPAPSSVVRGVSQYDPKTQMYTRPSSTPSKPPASSPSPLPRSKEPSPPPTPVFSTTRSFLSFLTSAFTGGAVPTFSVPPLPTPPSSFLSSRRFASLTLSPSEERSAAQLLSSLSSYLDLLELTLTSQIHLRSSSFFSSLLTINSLHADVSSVISHIQSIQEQLLTTSRHLTSSTLRTLSRVQRRSRLLLVYSHTRQLQMTARRTERCRSLMEQGRWSGVLALIHETRVALMGEGLKGVKAAEGMEKEMQRMLEVVRRGLKNELMELIFEGIDDGETESRKVGRELREEEQEKAFELTQCLYHVQAVVPCVEQYREEMLRKMKEATQEYLEALTASLHNHVQSSHLPSPTASPQSSSSPGHGQAQSMDLTASSSASPPSTGSSSSSPVASTPPKERSFQAALSAILPSRITSASPITSPRVPAADPIAPIVHPVALPTAHSPSSAASSSSAPISDPSALLARHLSSLSSPAYLDVLRALFKLWLDSLHRVVSVRSVVQQAISHIPSQLFLTDTTFHPHFLHDTPPPTLSTDQAAATAAFSSLLSSVADWMHAECSRIVALRPPEQQLSTLSALISLLSSFLSDTAELTGARGASLRTAMSSLTSSYLSSFHSFHSSALLEKLNKEQWTRVDVPKEFQTMLDSKYVRKVAVIEPSSSLPPPPTSSDAIVSARVFFVETVNATGQSTFDKFPTVPAVLSLLHSTSLYLDLASHLPTSAAEVSERLMQQLSTFNSRTHALILGAGALKSAGLKTITTTHIALCAQCIGLLLTQLPVIASRLPPPPPSSIACPSLAQLMKDYAGHQKELLMKLESIMNDLADAAFKKLIPNLRLDPPSPPAPSLSSSFSSEPEPDQLLKTLMTQTRSLNASLSQILSLEQRSELFAHLCGSYCGMYGSGVKKGLDLSQESQRARAAAAASWMMKQFYLLPGQDMPACKEIAQLLHIADMGLPVQSTEGGGAGSETGKEEVKENGGDAGHTATVNGVSSSASSSSPSVIVKEESSHGGFSTSPSTSSPSIELPATSSQRTAVLLPEENQPETERSSSAASISSAVDAPQPPPERAKEETSLAAAPVVASTPAVAESPTETSAAKVENEVSSLPTPANDADAI